MQEPDPKRRVDPPKTSWWFRLVLMVVALGAVVAQIGPSLNQEFHGYFDPLAAEHVILGQNHVLFGLDSTNGIPCRGTGLEPPKKTKPAFKRPPLFYAILASIPGIDSESPRARWAPFVLTLVSVLLFTSIALRVARPFSAAIASLLFASFPATAYYGRIPMPDVLQLTVILFTVWSCLCYRDRATKLGAARLACAGAATMLGGWTGFGGLVVASIFCWKGETRRDRVMGVTAPWLGAVLGASAWTGLALGHSTASEFWSAIAVSLTPLPDFLEEGTRTSLFFMGLWNNTVENVGSPQVIRVAVVGLVAIVIRASSRPCGLPLAMLFAATVSHAWFQAQTAYRLPISTLALAPAVALLASQAVAFAGDLLRRWHLDPAPYLLALTVLVPESFSKTTTISHRVNEMSLVWKDVGTEIANKCDESSVLIIPATTRASVLELNARRPVRYGVGRIDALGRIPRKAHYWLVVAERDLEGSPWQPDVERAKEAFRVGAFQIVRLLPTQKGPEPKKGRPKKENTKPPPK